MTVREALEEYLQELGLSAPIDGVRLEVKYVGKLDLSGVWSRIGAEAAKRNEIPVLLFRRVNKRSLPWLVVHALDDWPELSRLVRRAVDAEKHTTDRS